MARLMHLSPVAVVCALLALATPEVAAAPKSSALELRRARARFGGTHLRVTVPWRGNLPAGTLTVRLLDLQGRRLATATSRVAASSPGPARLRLTVPRAHRRGLDLLRLWARFEPAGGGATRPARIVALSEVGDMPFVWLRGQRRLLAGSRAALRIQVHDLQQRALARVPVSLTIRARRRTVRTLGRTDRQGGLQLRFSVPHTWSGRTARLVLTAGRGGQARVVRREIRIGGPVEAQLTTDKPLYQPGQQVHLRLLALRQPSRKPWARTRVRFTATDARSTRLLSVRTRTDDFGVAWTRLRLSAFARLGPLTLRARLIDPDGKQQTFSKTVRVSRYRVPPFRVRLAPERGHYRPGTRLTATVHARYLQGQPVGGARVRVEARLLRKTKGCSGARGYARGYVRCRIYEQTTLHFATVKGRTDRRGQLRITARIPRSVDPRILRRGGARVQLTATVIEPGGHVQRAKRVVPVSRHAVLLAALPETGTLVRGVKQRIYLVAAHPDGTPAPGAIRVKYRQWDPKAKRLRTHRLRVKTDAQGVATLTLRPTQSDLRLSLTATDRRGGTGYRSVALSAADSRVLVRPLRSVWRGGERLQVLVRTAGLHGRVYLDVKHRGQTVQAVASTLVRGRAFVPVPLPPTLDGLVTVTARVGGPLQGWHQGWAPTLVQSSRRLRVQIRAGRRSYRPGALAQLDVRVTDEHGRGKRAAVGLTLVDQGVYVLAGTRPGGEERQFLLEAAARDAAPLAGWTLGRLLTTARHRRRAALAGALLARLRETGFSAPPDTLVRKGPRDFDGYRRRVKQRVTRRLTGWFVQRLRRFRNAQRRWWLDHHRLHPLCPGDELNLSRLATLVQSKRLRPAQLLDPWHVPLRWHTNPDDNSRHHMKVYLQSAGPDAQWETVDDLKVGPYRLVLPRVRRRSRCSRWRRGYGVGSYRARSPRVFMSRASVSGGLDLPASALPTVDSAGPRARVRRTFRETVLVRPDLRTDSAGRASLRVRLADNITTWVAHGVASTRDGRLGSAVSHLTATKPLWADVWLPQRLTRGDEVEVPVVVHNDTPRAESVTVRLTRSQGIVPLRQPDVRVRLMAGPFGPRLLRQAALTDARTRRLVVAARSLATVRFRVRATAVGQGSMTVEARARGVADAVQRTVLIRPGGYPVTRGESGPLAAGASHDLHLPPDFVAGSQRLAVTLEPDLVSTTLASLDSLLQRPHGCMEQSSAITYPNVLVLRHLRRKKPATRAARGHLARARRLVDAGYQRLLTYEVAGGGFSLYGSAPADASLTALGLSLLNSLSAVRYVDPRVVKRTRRHLLKRQTASGSWTPEGYVDLGGSDPLTRRYLVTAYITWQLGRSARLPGRNHRRLRRALDSALDFLRAHLFLVHSDPYGLALAANAAALSRSPRARALLSDTRRRLTALARRATAVSWRPASGRSTVFAGRGRSATVETTALALLALRTAPGARPLLQGGQRYLHRMRSPDGAWSTTRATVLALQALLATAGRRSRRPKAVRVFLDGKHRGTLRPRTQGATTETLDLSAGLRPGRHTVRLQPVGGGHALYRVGLRYYRQKRPKPLRRGPRLQVTYSRQRLTAGQWVRVRVRLQNRRKTPLLAPMAEIGLPPNFRLYHADRRRLARLPGVERIERMPGKLVLYFRSLAKSTRRLSFRLQARFGGRVRVPPSRLYEYYRPESAAHTAGATIEVRPRS